MYKSVVITGGSRGIGKAIVDSFALHEYKVFYSYKENKGLESSNIIPIKADFSMSEEIAIFFEKVKSKSSTIDCLINNVGEAKFSLLASQTEVDFDKAFNINCRSAWLAFKHTLPLLKPGSCVINISSISSYHFKRGSGIYSTTKAFLNSLSYLMQSEVYDKGIRVYTLLPGFVLTERLKELQYKDLMKKNLQEVPMQRFAEPNEIGDIVYFLTTLSSIHGFKFFITGGQHLT